MKKEQLHTWVASIRQLALLLFFSTLTVHSIAQTDNQFWFAAPDISDGGGSSNLDKPIILRLSSSGPASTVTISLPANVSFTPLVVSVPANGIVSVDLTAHIASIENFPQNTVNNKGLLIQSTTPISAYYEVLSSFCNCNPEIFALKGTNALGTKFYTPFQTYLNNSSGYNPIARSSFIIVATEENTVVNITPTKALIGRSANVTYSITLNKGQSYSGAASGLAGSDHPTGTLIESNKPIAVTMSDDLLSGAPYGGCADQIGDQLIPVNKVGLEYVVMKGQLNGGAEKAFVVATENNTTISVDGSPVATINAGAEYVATFSAATVFISSNKPVYVLHLSGFGCEVGGAILPPITCSGSSQVAVARSTSETFILNLLVKAGGQSTFLFNGNSGIINSSSFTAVPNTSNQWFSAQITLPTSTLAAGNSALISNTSQIFHLGIIHGGSTSGARFGYFSNFSTANVVATSNSPNSGGSINLGATPGFSSYSWTGPNGFTSSLQNPVINNASSVNTGQYVVTVTSSSGCVGTSTTNVTVVTSPAASLSFDGSNDFVSIPSGINLANQSFTFECWARAASSNRDNIVAGQGPLGNNTGLHIGFRPNNVFTFAFYNNDLNTSTGYGDLNWHHWACVYDITPSGNIRSIYRDGVLVARDFPTNNFAGSGIFYIGRHDWGANFHGNIDEVRIWNRALCQSEIQNNMNCELGGTQSNLLRYYKFNQGLAADINASVTSLTDASGNGISGTLNNFNLTGTSSNWVAPGGVTTGTTCSAFVPPVATITPPATTILCAGSAISLNANTGVGLTYQWLLNGNIIAGATNSNYIANAVGSYTVRVTQNGCSTTSSPLVITPDQTLPTAVCKNVTLALNASGIATIVIPATTNTLLFENWTGDNAGYYAANNPSHPSSTLNWNVLSGDIDRADFASGIPGFEIDLAGFQNGVIESKQTFNFTPGSYTFSFQQIANALGGNGVQVEIGSLLNQTFITSLSVTSESVTFTVTANVSAKVRLTQVGPNDARGSFIGQIRLVRNIASTLAIENGSTDNCSVASITASKTNFTCADLGTNTVTLSVTDGSGNVGTCQATVTIEDNIAPVLSACPSNITTVATGASGAVVTFTAPTATDNCSATVTQIAGPASGSVFPLGTTNVTFEAADPAGNKVTCSFTVTISGLAPVIVSPGNISANTSTNGCTAVVNYQATETTAVPASTITYSIPSGSVFPVGTTQVTATATNVVGTSSTTFNVVVSDNILPNAITKNININLNGSGNATISAADINDGSTDNCGINSITVNPSSFNCSNIGPNTVTLTVRDNNNNVSTATATVTVNDSINPVITCPTNISVSATSGSCGATINIDRPTATDNCSVLSNAIALDGVNDYVRVPRSVSADFTIEYWMKTSQTASTGTQWYNGSGIVDAEVGGVTNDFGTALVGNRVAFGVGAPDVTIFSTTPVNSGNWVHVAVTRKQSTGEMKLYINGVLESSATGSTSLLTAPANITMGVLQTLVNPYFNGTLDDIRIWNVVRTQTEIQSNRSRAFSGSMPAGLVAYYNCDQGIAGGPNNLIGSLGSSTGVNGGTLLNFAMSGNTSNFVAGTSGIPSLTLTNSANNSFNASGFYPVGVTNVVWTATDGSGNTSTCTQTITVTDNSVPNVITKSTTVYLDENGTVTLNPAMIDNGSNDACGIQSMSVNPATLGCSNAVQANAGAGSFSARMTVDNQYTIYVSTNDNVQGTAFGSNDNWTVLDNHTTALTPGVINYIHILAQDVGGPEMLIGDFSLTGGFRFANGTQSATTNATDVRVSSTGWSGYGTPLELSTGNSHGIWGTIGGISSTAKFIWSSPWNTSGFDTRYFSIAVLPVSVASNVTLSVTDIHGNTGTAGALVTVLDTIKPVISCVSDITVLATSAAGATVSYATPTATDNCSATVTRTVGSASGSVFPIGTTTVTHTATDVAGNSVTCSFNITVSGLPPVIVSPGTISVNTTTNACSAVVNYNVTETTGIPASVITYSIPSGSTFAVGTTQVTATATNAVGSSSVTFDVVVTDAQLPNAIAQNLSINLDATGNASITAAQVNNGSNDACGIKSISVSPSAFTCANVGANTVTLTVTDNNDNVSTATATVTVSDVTAPNAIAQNLSINLDATGNASITAAQVNNGSNDACGIKSISVSQSAYTCANVGANTVTLTVTDNNDNVSTTTATVTVSDVTAPNAIAQNLSINLDATGNASITAAQVNNGSNDACGIKSISVSPSAFTCANVGANTVTLTVTDNNDNVSTTTATVTVSDVTAPNAIAQNLSINLDATGNASITAAQVNNGSNDACGIKSISVSPSAFTCANVGANTVTLTVTDNNDNVSTTTATVTVSDVTAPVVITQNVSVTISGGSASITAAQINNGSNDACGIKSISVSPSTFNCSNIGANTVTLTVTDNNNNVSTGTAIVTVNGVVPTCTIASAPRNNGVVIGSTTTLAAANQMFLGYGPQSMNITCTATGAGPFTYSWSGQGLNNTTVANPIFTPTAAGNYTLTCTVTNSFGCQTTCSIVICVIDVRANGGSPSNPKVLLCHVPPGNPNNPQTLSISVNAVPAHLGLHGGDKLGSCNAVCGFSKNGNEIGELFTEETETGDIDLIVYPNPSKDMFNFRLESSSTEPVTIKVYDLSGRIVYERNNIEHTEEIKLTQLTQAGVYLAEITQGTYKKTVKITKIH